MKKPNGFILMTTLIFIFLLSLFAYQALEGALVEIKLHQTVEQQKFLFAQAQKNLKAAEINLRKRCSLSDQKNKHQCVTVELIKRSEYPDDQVYKIISKTFRGDWSVILESTCLKAKTSKTCAERLSWEQVSVE